MLSIERQIFEQVDKAARILITFNRNWKGDAIGSALALRAWLEKRGKEVEVVAEKSSLDLPYAFLPGYALIQHSLDNLRRFIISLDISKTSVDQIEYRVEDHTLDFIISPRKGFFTHDDISSRSGGFRYDLIFVLGAPDLESLGSVYDNDTEFFFETPIINIDHQAANENFGQINLVDLKAVATAEVVSGLLRSDEKTKIDGDIATCLLTGLIAETKSFKTSNVTPQTLQVVSDLVAHEGRREEIINALYRSRRLNVLKLWGSVLTRLESAADNRLVWSTIRAADFGATRTAPAHLLDIVDELIISMPQAQLILLFYEDSAAQATKALIYSVKNLDALELSRPFGGHGTRTMATVELTLDLEAAAQKLTQELTRSLEKL